MIAIALIFLDIVLRLRMGLLLPLHPRQEGLPEFREAYTDPCPLAPEGGETRLSNCYFCRTGSGYRQYPLCDGLLLPLSLIQKASLRAMIVDECRAKHIRRSVKSVQIELFRV
jgi:hypothetical protein